jgi:hypothetical protein
MRNLIMFVMSATLSLGNIISCTKKSEPTLSQKITIEQCYKAKVIIVDETENFDDKVEHARNHMNYECRCIVVIGDTDNGVLITFYGVDRGGTLMWDYDGDSHGVGKFVDNIYKQIMGEEMPKEMCK